MSELKTDQTLMQIRRLPIGVMYEEENSLLKCIKTFECGCENIYILNSKLKYTGRAISKETFLKSWEQALQYEIPWDKKNAEFDLPALYDEVLSEGKRTMLSETLGKLLKEYLQTHEFPVVNNNSRLSAVIGMTIQNDQQISWKSVPFAKALHNYRRIYVSSLNNKNIYNFYMQYQKHAPIYVLDDKYLMDAIYSKDILLIYGTDVFPECSKMSIRMIYERYCPYEAYPQEKLLKKVPREEILRHHIETIDYYEKRDSIRAGVSISKVWATIDITQAWKFSDLVACFDEGYQTIVVQGYDGKMLGILDISRFRENFPFQFRIIDDQYSINWCDDVDTLEENVADMLIKSELEEVPILRNGKVVSIGVRGNELNKYGIRDFEQKQKFNWDCISDEVAIDFFSSKRRVLISSTNGKLQGFRERFSNILTIDVYDETVTNAYFNREYDLIIYGADLWPDVGEKQDVRQIYADMLAETVSRYLKKNGIDYYYLDISTPSEDMKDLLLDEPHRNTILSLMPNSYSHGKILSSSWKRNYQKDSNPHIFFSGACVSAGTGIVASMESVEYKLQEMLADDYHIIPDENISIGNRLFSDINNLHRILEVELCNGDIVIQMGGCLWKKTAPFSLQTYYSIRDAFLYGNTCKCLWKTDPVYMDKNGCQLVAKYLYSLIKDRKLEKRSQIQSRQSFLSVFSEQPIHLYVKYELIKGKYENPVFTDPDDCARYVIVGTDDVALSACSFLGSSWIDCFVDNDSAGQEILGIPVLTWDLMLQRVARNPKYILVITENAHNEHMERKFNETNGQRCFVFYKKDVEEVRKKYQKIQRIDGRLLPLSYGERLGDCQIRSYRKISILGNTQYLHYMICAIATLHGWKPLIGIILESKTENINTLGLPIHELEYTRGNIDCLFVNMSLKDNSFSNKIDYYYSQDFSVIYVYDAIKDRKEWNNPIIRKYKNIHNGKRCFLVGAGPSLTVKDLDTLHLNHEITFGCNYVYRLFNQTRWRPDYFCFIDGNRWRDVQEDAIPDMSCPFFCNRDWLYAKDIAYLPSNAEIINYRFDWFFKPNAESNMPKFSEDPSKVTYWGGTVLYDIALQMAAYMGFSEIYLLGVDWSFANKKEGEAHFSGYLSQKQEETMGQKNMIGYSGLKGWEKAKLYALQHGFRIYNATRGGDLEVFERVNFDSLFDT